jgi:hypothetical protein
MFFIGTFSPVSDLPMLQICLCYNSQTQLDGLQESMLNAIVDLDATPSGVQHRVVREIYER